MRKDLKCGVVLTGLLFAAGCLPQSYRRVNVTVIDGETGAAVPQAAILAPQGEWGAAAHHAETDSMGKATLKEAVGVMAEASGYLPSPVQGFTSRDDGVLPNEWTTVIKLYRVPTPIVGISFPRGFKGVVRVFEYEATSKAVRHAPPSDGTREFYTDVNPQGTTVTIPAPLLAHNQSYRATVMCARFQDGPLLRFENPTERSGWGGEFVYGLPDIRDRVAPSPDGVAMFDLGVYMAPLPEYARIFFVGTAAQANVAQQELIALYSGRYTFRPAPLSIDGLEVGTQLSPRFDFVQGNANSAPPRR